MRSPIMQEGDDWYAIDVTDPEGSGPSDPDLYNMPMVPKGPGLVDSSAMEDPPSSEGAPHPNPSRCAHEPSDPSWCGGTAAAVRARIPPQPFLGCMQPMCSPRGLAVWRGVVAIGRPKAQELCAPLAQSFGVGGGTGVR
jgi:hypothetical protein